MNFTFTVKETIKLHSSEDIDMFIVKKMKAETYDKAVSIAKTLGNSEVVNDWTMEVVWNSDSPEEE